MFEYDDEYEYDFQGRMPLLSHVDYAVVAVYFVLMAGLGWFAKSLVKNLEDYFACGRRVPWWMAGISHHMSGYSAFAFVGYAGVAYTAGFSIWTLFAFPCATAMTLGAFVWAPRWARLNVLTPVAYLEQRFNNLVRQLVAWSGIAIKFIDEGLKLYALAVIITACTGLPLNATIVGCGIVAVFYVAVGGLWADILTDFCQFIVQFAITIPLAFVALRAVGGWDSLWQQLPAEQGRFFGKEYDLPYILVFLVVITLSYNGGTWGLAQRFYSVKQRRDAQKAALLSAFLYFLYPLFIYIPVWAAPLLVGQIEKPEQAYIVIAGKFLPAIAPGLMGLMVAAMFAATMSMVDSDLNALAGVFTKDIYQRMVNPEADERRLLKVGLMATVVLGAITVACGLATPHLGGAFKAMMDWYAALLGPISIPLLFGMVWRRTTWRGAVAAWLGGFLTFALCKYGLKTSWTIYTGAELAVAFGIFFAEGFLFRQTSQEAERVKALFGRIGSDGVVE